MQDLLLGVTQISATARVEYMIKVAASRQQGMSGHELSCAIKGRLQEQAEASPSESSGKKKK